MIDGDKVFGSPPPWTEEMHKKWLKELKELSKIPIVMQFENSVVQLSYP